MNFNAKEQTIIKTHLKVAKVVDGDGIIVTNIFNNQQEEIRLLGIDAPEIKKCRKANQDERELHIAGQLLMELGQMAQKYLFTLVPPETNITLVMEKENHTDMYGRTLAYVYLAGGECVNELMIKSGYAKPYNRIFCSELPNYQLLSNTAKIKRMGLFSVVKNW